jgi:hypothetical protein
MLCALALGGCRQVRKDRIDSQVNIFEDGKPGQ